LHALRDECEACERRAGVGGAHQVVRRSPCAVPSASAPVFPSACAVPSPSESLTEA
jgi:hypothetical protein